MNYLIEFFKSAYNFLINSWGLTLALVGFVAQKFFVPQILNYRTILERCRYDVIYYANVFPLPDNRGKFVNKKEIDEAHKELRIIAARVRAHRGDIPCYKLVALAGLIPTFENTEIIATNLIGWSNDMYETRPEEQARQQRRENIAMALGMKHY
jgi:hypothetical protein